MCELLRRHTSPSIDTGADGLLSILIIMLMLTLIIIVIIIFAGLVIMQEGITLFIDVFEMLVEKADDVSKGKVLHKNIQQQCRVTWLCISPSPPSPSILPGPCR
jgi:hypothetical protein